MHDNCFSVQTLHIMKSFYTMMITVQRYVQPSIKIHFVTHKVFGMNLKQLNDQKILAEYIYFLILLFNTLVQFCVVAVRTRRKNETKIIINNRNSWSKTEGTFEIYLLRSSMLKKLTTP